ncbi:hypothetical protein EVAR_79530_1 [Eumeta japonica]|uniref:Uncharacterized protein n=1 Tax=Eumeta variegata TaxID=151549 RepID=A0A4C1Y5Q6_EUMVA|nr:hypothetical protein EVAR_79530_1 [Eumeta japonica]
MFTDDGKHDKDIERRVNAENKNRGVISTLICMTVKAGYGRRKIKVGSMQWRCNSGVVCGDCFRKIDVVVTGVERDALCRLRYNRGRRRNQTGNAERDRHRVWLQGVERREGSRLHSAVGKKNNVKITFSDVLPPKSEKKFDHICDESCLTLSSSEGKRIADLFQDAPVREKGRMLQFRQTGFIVSKDLKKYIVEQI